MSSPAETSSPAPRLERKPVYYERFPIGEAATRAEVEALLVAYGRNATDARHIVMTRGVEGPDGFWIITALQEQAMLAELRAVMAGTCKPTLNPPPRPVP